MTSIRSILLAFVLILLSIGLFGQNQFGIRQGAAVTTLSMKGDLLDNTHVTYSYVASAFYDLQLNKSFAVQPEINYIRKGRYNETSELNVTNPTDFLLHYIQIPVLLQFRDAKTLEQTGSCFYINAGPYASFVVDNQTRPSNSALVPESNKTDWGVIFGIGYQTPIFRKDIRFDLRYDMGLSSIANQPEEYHTKALSLTLGIAL